MHVVHLSSAEVYGGAEEHIRTLLKALKAQARPDDQISLVCPEQAPLKKRLSSEQISLYALDFKGKKDLLAPWRLRQLVKKIQPDVIHSHGRREDLATVVGLAGLSVKKITTLHDRVNMLPNGQRSQTIFDRMYLKILKYFDQIMAVSEATLQDYLSLGTDCRDPKHFQWITNGMDLSRLISIAPDPNFRKRHGIDPQAFLIMLSARVRHGDFGKKGHLRLLEVLAQIKQSLHLVTIGEDAASALLLEAEASRRKIPYTSMGFVEDALPILVEADVVVLPSLFEGLPRSLMEAMALGKAVVGSDVDGISSLTDAGRAGCLAGTHDVKAWQSHIEGLMANPQKRLELGRKAVQRIHNQFSDSKMAGEHWDLYRAL